MPKRHYRKTFLPMILISIVKLFYVCDCIVNDYLIVKYLTSNLNEITIPTILPPHKSSETPI